MTTSAVRPRTDADRFAEQNALGYDERIANLVPGYAELHEMSAAMLAARLGPQARVLVVGDSHAVMWMPGLQRVAEDNGWRLDLQAKLSCAPVDATVLLNDRPFTACRAWARNVLGGIGHDPPELVVLALSPAYVLESPGTEPRGLSSALSGAVGQIRAAGPQVALMAVPPRFAEPVPACLAAHADDPETCRAYLPSAVPENQWAQVADSLSGVHTIDLLDQLCPGGTCLTDADGILRFEVSDTFRRILEDAGVYKRTREGKAAFLRFTDHVNSL